MPLKLNGTNSVAAPAYAGDDADTGLQCGTDELKLVTGGTARATVDSSGNVGIGSSTINQTGSGRTVLGINGASNALLNFNHSDTLAGFMYGANDEFRMEANGSRPLIFRGNSSERMRIDSSGRLLVGLSSARANFYNSTNSPYIQLEGNNNNESALAIIQDFDDQTQGAQLVLAKNNSQTIGSNVLIDSGDQCGIVSFQGNDGTQFVEAASIISTIDGTPGANDMPGRLSFLTTADGASSPTERMRIDSTGSLYTFSTAFNTLLSTAAAASTSDSILAGAHSATAVNTGTICFRVTSNGNVTNTNNSYGSISDAKLKENIVDASSQWEDIKGLRVRNYNFIEGQTHTQIGVVAQEVETVSPGLVTDSPDLDEEGNDLGTVTKSVNYSVLYMKAVKALQEAQTRIETLETQHADLLARVTALEAAS
tara:strand:- start:964 stop:2241 length:1278 start_codon:yes stop_codon:yes gene_type:complete